MRVIVTRHLEYHRPGTPLTFTVKTGEHVLPRDVCEHVIAVGAGRRVDHQPGDRSGGIAATIAHKQRRTV